MAAVVILGIVGFLNMPKGFPFHALEPQQPAAPQSSAPALPAPSAPVRESEVVPPPSEAPAAHSADDEAFSQHDLRLRLAIADLTTRLTAAEELLEEGERRARGDNETAAALLKSDPVFVELQRAAQQAEAAVIQARARGGEVASLSQQWIATKGRMATYSADRMRSAGSPQLAKHHKEVEQISTLLAAARLDQIKLYAWRQNRGLKPSFVP